jgi:hypothetical protein
VLGVLKKRGVSVLSVNLNPVVYLPKSGLISYYNTLTLKVTFKSTANPLVVNEIKYRPDVILPIDNSVDNPGAINTYDSLPVNMGPAPLGCICNPLATYQYVIVTSRSIINAMTTPNVNDLLTQKRNAGLSATAVTIEDVYNGYAGVDNAEKLRILSRMRTITGTRISYYWEVIPILSR